MKASSMKFAITAISLVAFSVACSHKNRSHQTAVAGKDPGALVEQKAKDNAARMTEVFSQMDITYDFNNRTLTDKIQGITLTSVTPNLSGFVLIKGVEQPVEIYSADAPNADLKTGNIVPVTVSGEAQGQVEEVVGGPLTVKAKCLDPQCQQIAVYFRIYQGAGYIFEQSAEGYKMVNAIGPAVSVEEAMTVRSRNARNE